MRELTDNECDTIVDDARENSGSGFVRIAYAYVRAGHAAGYRAAQRELALAVAAMVAEECAKECESERVDAVASGADDDRVYNAACDHCAAAIRRSAEGLR